MTSMFDVSKERPHPINPIPGESLLLWLRERARPDVAVSEPDAEDWGGLTGTELPAELEARSDVMATLEEVRGITAEMIGIVGDRREAKAKSPGVPKVAVVAPSRAYRTTGGAELGADGMDLVGRFLSMGTANRSYPVTGAICTGAAAIVEGSVVREASRAPVREGKPTVLRIANPYGITDVRVRWERGSEGPHVLGAAIGRTARCLMEGYAHVPRLRVEV